MRVISQITHTIRETSSTTIIAAAPRTHLAILTQVMAVITKTTMKITTDHIIIETILTIMVIIRA